MKDIIHRGAFMIDMFLYLLFHNGHLFKFGTIQWVTFNPALNNPFLGNGMDLLSGTNTVVFCFSPQLETVFSVNVLQFIFLSLKLDRVIYWSWVVSTHVQ